jgi:hypothetical protein
MNKIAGSVLFVCCFLASLASAQTTSTGGAPAGGQRRALLIGIESYSSDRSNTPAITSLSSSGFSGSLRFRNLTGPCNDIDELEAQLVRLGWSTDQITKFCVRSPSPGDQGDRRVDLRIANLRQIVTEFGARMFDVPRGFGLVWIAAHGIEMFGRNYVIPERGELNLDRALDRLRKSARSPGVAASENLFPSEALDVVDTLFTSVGQGCQCDVLLILDTCREDPLLATPFGRQIGQIIPLEGDFNRGRDARGGMGRSVLLATGSGGKVQDNPSLLRRAFVQQMQRDVRVDDIINRVIAQVTEESYNTNNAQIPYPYGRLQYMPYFSITQRGQRDNVGVLTARVNVNTTTNISRNTNINLLSDDEYVAISVNATNHDIDVMAPVTFEHRFITQSAGSIYDSVAQLAENSVAPRLIINQRATVNQNPPLPSDNINGMFIDIYWCEGEGEQERKRLADAYFTIVQREYIRQSTAGGIPLSRVRVLPLSTEVNINPTFRISANEIRHESGTPVARQWAERLRRLTATSLQQREVRTGLPSLINVFYCRGIVTERPASRLWLQVSNLNQRTSAISIGQSVREQISDVSVAGTVEIVPDNSPLETQVRYFYPQDRVLAEQIAELASGEVQPRPRAVYVSVEALPRTVQPGLQELWIGRNARNIPPINLLAISAGSIAVRRDLLSGLSAASIRRQVSELRRIDGNSNSGAVIANSLFSIWNEFIGARRGDITIFLRADVLSENDIFFLSTYTGHSSRELRDNATRFLINVALLSRDSAEIIANVLIDSTISSTNYLNIINNIIILRDIICNSRTRTAIPTQRLNALTTISERFGPDTRAILRASEVCLLAGRR